MIENEITRLAEKRTALAAERSRLANQRTYLAWVRTGLASVGGGVAIIRLLVFQNPQHQAISQTVGAALVVLGIGIFAGSFWEYYDMYRKLKVKSGYAGSIWSIAFVTVMFCILSAILLIIILKDL